MSATQRMLVTVGLGVQLLTLILLLTISGSRDFCMERYGACPFPYYKYYDYLLVAFVALSVLNLALFYRYVGRRRE